MIFVVSCTLPSFLKTVCARRGCFSWYYLTSRLLKYLFKGRKRKRSTHRKVWILWEGFTFSDNSTMNRVNVYWHQFGSCLLLFITSSTEIKFWHVLQDGNDGDGWTFSGCISSPADLAHKPRTSDWEKANCSFCDCCTSIHSVKKSWYFCLAE